MSGELRGPKREAGEVRPINSSAKLAKALGFARNPNEKEPWYREFWKPVGEGRATLAFQDGSLIRSGERIIIGVKLSELSSKNDGKFNLCQDKLFADQIRELGLTLDETPMFVKPELKNGGYLKLYHLLSKLEADGFYEDQLKKLAEE